MKPQDRTTSAALWIIALSLFAIAVSTVYMAVTQPRAEHQPADSGVVISDEWSSASAAPPANSKALRLATHPRVASGEMVKAAGHGAVATLQAAPTSGNARTSEIRSDTQAALVAPPGGVVIDSSEVVTLIQGTVTLSGDAPPEQTISCGGTSSSTHFFITDTNNGLGDVLVFISSAGEQTRRKTVQFTNVLTLKDCQLQPFVFASFEAFKGLLKNAGGEQHHFTISSGGYVHVDPKASASFSMTDVGKFQQVRCLDHNSEVAYISILDNPFFALTRRDGHFAITNAPPGRYSIKAMHRGANQMRNLTQPIEVREGEITPVNFVFQETATKQVTSR